MRGQVGFDFVDAPTAENVHRKHVCLLAHPFFILLFRLVPFSPARRRLLLAAYMNANERLKRSSVMARVRSTNTSPEVRLRKALFTRGYRFRLYDPDLPGKPDIVLAKYRAVIFVNGCFWHWHGCARSRMPSSNVDYWKRKIGRNRLRDEKNYQSLRISKRRVLVVWECALKPSVLKRTVTRVEHWLNSNRSYFSIG